MKKLKLKLKLSTLYGIFKNKHGHFYKIHHCNFIVKNGHVFEKWRGLINICDCGKEMQPNRYVLLKNFVNVDTTISRDINEKGYYLESFEK